MVEKKPTVQQQIRTGVSHLFNGVRGSKVPEHRRVGKLVISSEFEAATYLRGRGFMVNRAKLLLTTYEEEFQNKEDRVVINWLKEKYSYQERTGLEDE
jgi:hypothetical protein